MIKSMTGYGRHREVIDGRDILCEVKSVNSRYLDTNIKLGRMYTALEDTVKQYASSRVSRGKMDIYISIDNIEGNDNGLSVNEKFLESYVALLDKQLDMVEKSGLFEEVGKSGHGFVPGGDVEGKIESIASEIMKADPNMDRFEAINKAWEQNPELLDQYERKLYGGK